MFSVFFFCLGSKSFGHDADLNVLGLAVYSSAAWRERQRARLRTIQTRDERQARIFCFVVWHLVFFDVFP